jgi:hypothetical protein
VSGKGKEEEPEEEKSGVKDQSIQHSTDTTHHERVRKERREWVRSAMVEAPAMMLFYHMIILRQSVPFSMGVEFAFHKRATFFRTSG